MQICQLPSTHFLETVSQSPNDSSTVIWCRRWGILYCIGLPTKSVVPRGMTTVRYSTYLTLRKLVCFLIVIPSVSARDPRTNATRSSCKSSIPTFYIVYYGKGKKECKCKQTQVKVGRAEGSSEFPPPSSGYRKQIQHFSCAASTTKCVLCLRIVPS